MEVRKTFCAALAVVSAVLVGCAPSTKVAVAVNAPSYYSHVYLTISALWFNSSAAAGPDDTTWLKYPLSTPVTIDLAGNSSDAVAALTSNLTVTPGTYAQVRLIPLDSNDTLAKSASTLGAVYNAEVDYVDSTGKTNQLPLELVNPEKGIGLSGTVKVPRGDLPGDSASASTFSLGLAFDGARDLVMLNDGSNGKVLLNPHATAYDLGLAGAVTGTVSISTLSAVVVTNGRTDLQVTAEALSADGSRHLPVLSVPVRSDGTFTLYPLTTDKTTPASYDLVIHGPAIATIVVRGVTVNAGSVSASTTTSIGTVAPRSATAFKVNIAHTTTATLPAGAVTRFYQTLPDSSEVPYTIEQNSIEPFTRVFPADFSLSTGTLDFGTFSSTGATIALIAKTPVEGAGVYKVAGSAPSYADGAMTTTVAAPASSSAATASVTVPSLTVASGAVASTLTATIGQSVARSFNRGELIVSHDGSVVESVSLDSVLQQTNGGIVTIENLPGGTSSTTFDPGLYYLSARVWNSATPATTLLRESFLAPVDLRNTATAAFTISVN